MKTNSIFYAALTAACLVGCTKQMPTVPAANSQQPPTVAEARAEAAKFAGLSQSSVFALQSTAGTAIDATVQWNWAHTVKGQQTTWLRVPIAMPQKNAPFSSMAMQFAKEANGTVQAWLTTENLVRLNDTLRRAVTFYTPQGKLHHALLLRDEQRKMYRLNVQLPEASGIDRRSGGCKIEGYVYMTISCQTVPGGGPYDVSCRLTTHNHFNISCWGVGAEQSLGDGTGGAGGGEGNGNLVLPEDALAYDEEEDLSSPVANLEKLLKCFSNLPDAGATYSAKIYVDIPNNADPTRLLAGRGNPGHTFIRLTKTNGDKTITQTFGFYPQNGPKSVVTLGPVPSETRQNGQKDKEHEYNASYALNSVSQVQFQAMLQQAAQQATRPYDLTDFNCTSYALGIINAGLPAQSALQSLPAVVVHPVSLTPVAFKDSPSGLFLYLKALQSNPAQASNIEMNVDKNGSTSYGECN
jgi:hypothetical protein